MSGEDDLFDGVLPRVVQFFIDGQEWDIAEGLLVCDARWECNLKDGYDERAYTVILYAPRPFYDEVSEFNSTMHSCLRTAFSELLPYGYWLNGFATLPKVADPGPNWRTDLMQAIEGKAVHNQAVSAEKVFVWQNLRFRSAAEQKIAEALDAVNVMFLPNCKGRLGFNKRENREPDFLVCYNGKWGILEVDGETFHPPTRTTQDHERDRLFRQHGIQVVEHFDATKCAEDPEGVVQEFLRILGKAY